MKRKVLIIEDEFDLNLLLNLYLTDKKYEVSMAYNLKDGMNKLESFSPDILFLDNNLPDGYGWEKVDEILNYNPSIKVTLITGDIPSLPPSLVQKKLCILEKPISKKEIEKCLAA